MKLVLAEKPSVAMSLSKVIGADQRGDGYMEGNGYLVSWCVGHLVELSQPEAYDEKYAKWKYDDLPILPEHWQYQVSASTKKQFGILKKLMQRKDVESLICATDAGREGELIFRLVYHQCGCKKPVERLWISSMEDSAIREGFQKLRPGTEYDALYEAALCRERADWMVGINASRLFSCLYNQPLAVGRVMTPVLAMTVLQEAAIAAFVPEKFYTVSLTLADGGTASSKRFAQKADPPMPANWMYKRGDVYMMDLNPYSGSEQGGIRPAIVVQNDDGNFYSNVLLVVPLTTQIKKRNMPTHFILHNRFLSAPSMAICESPRPADKSRVLSYLGHLSKYEMRQVSVCLQYSFGFIGYKSFRKYLTAPPQEDVLAAAKELLSQQFQNLRVLNSQPPALAKHTKGDLHSIEQISERMLSTPTESSVEFMVAELDDALQSLMFRWNICYERYFSFRLSDNEKKKIGLIIQSGIDFLQKKKEVPL